MKLYKNGKLRVLCYFGGHLNHALDHEVVF